MTMRTSQPNQLRHPGPGPVDRKPEGRKSGGPRHAGGAGEIPVEVQPMMKVTCLIAAVEVSDYSEEGELTGRAQKNIFALEAEIPIEFRQWLLERAPVQTKEG